MNTIKVRVVKTGLAKRDWWYYDKDGQVFDVTHFDSTDYQCMGSDINGRPAENFYIAKTDCVIVEDEMETYTVKGVTYKQLKDITVKALILAGAEDGDIDHIFDNYDYNYTEPISLENALDCASSCNEKLGWLVDQGFTEKVEEELKPCPFCGGKPVWQSADRNWIKCLVCGIDTLIMDSTEEAISLWNKRV